MADAQAIVEVLVQAFPEPHDLQPEKIESVMRPFAPISFETEKRVRSLLYQRERAAISLRVGSWMEANFVVSGNGRVLEERILFLMSDTCSCVLQHLPEAIRHATNPVDPRILKLVE